MKKKYLILIVLLVVIIFTVVYKTINKPLYGNDQNSIIEVINSNELYKGKTINILDIKDFGDHRVVAFLSNDAPSVIEFRRDKNMNYKSTLSETWPNDNLSNFIINNLEKEDYLVVLSVKNQYSDINEFSFKANEDEYEVFFDTNNPNVQWTKLKKSIDGSYSFEWYYSAD
ncbi:hypothetical protein [Clostridium grantii]|uniref:hypothetical protein n=1 Tax=Clostridium grantii TaxID=40575 RepID=UPI0009337BFD|nr:hypothetical protein [Clostridium grantii]